MLALVAPISMSAEQQELWLRAAADSLEDIRPTEVRDISAELRRSVTRPAQIVPEIAKLVAEKRSRSSRPQISESVRREHEIDQEARRRRGEARNREEVEAASAWERQARTEAGLHVAPLSKPFTRDELDKMPPHIRKMGLSSGFLEYRDGKLVEVA